VITNVNKDFAEKRTASLIELIFHVMSASLMSYEFSRSKCPLIVKYMIMTMCTLINFIILIFNRKFSTRIIADPKLDRCYNYYRWWLSPH